MGGTRRPASWIIAAVGIIVSGTIGCAGSKPKTAAESRPISEAEALEFGESLADAIMSRDAGRVDAVVDLNAMAEEATQGVSAPWGFRRSFLEGARKAQERDGNPLMRELKPVIEAGGDMTATRATTWEGKPAVVLRMILPEGGAAYTIFLLDRRPDGRIRSADYYSLSSGELASQAVHRLYVSAAADANRGFVEKLLVKKSPLVAHISDLKRMAAANREGRPQEALTIYDGLPEEAKGEKSFVMMRFLAAQKVGDEAKYLEALEDFARRFPNDPACDFQSLDAFALQGQPEKALPALDRLEKVLAGDAYLKVIRAGVLVLMKRPDDAMEAFRAAAEAEPDLRPAYDGLLNAAVEQKRFGEVAKVLDALENRFDQEIGDLSEVEEFKEFLASPEGKAWAGRRESTKAAEGEAPGP